MKKFALALILSLFAASANAADCSSPENYVSSLSSQVINIAGSKVSDKAKEAQLTSLFKSVVNTSWMGKFVLGRNWNTITPAQQNKYIAVYGNYLAASYVPIFKKYNGEKIEVKGSKPSEREGEFLVSSVIVRTNDKIPVNYRIKKIGSCYKVNDIIAEGISLLNTQRQDFSAVFAAKGYDGLMEALTKKAEVPVVAAN
jgi:phospholipid transport system substrate-binding protein